MGEPEPTLKDVLNAIADLGRKIDGNTESIKKVETTLNAMQFQIDSNKSSIADNEREIKTLRSDFDEERKQLRQYTRSLEQKQVVNGVILKGFTTNDFDENEVLQNVIQLAGLTSPIFDFYKFFINIGKDKKKQQTKAAAHDVNNLLNAPRQNEAL